MGTKSYVTREDDGSGDDILTWLAGTGEEIQGFVLTDSDAGELKGQKVKASSIPVAIASDQDDLAIALYGATIAQTLLVSLIQYTAGDCVGGLLTFANAARANGGGGLLRGVTIIDDAGQDAEMELWLFNATFTPGVNNAPWAPSEADLRKLVAVISTGTGAAGWRAAGTPSVNDVECARRYDLVGTSLFGRLVTRGTPTFAATDDVTVQVALSQD